MVHEGLWPGSVAGGKDAVHGGCIQTNPALPEGYLLRADVGRLISQLGVR